MKHQNSKVFISNLYEIKIGDTVTWLNLTNNIRVTFKLEQSIFKQVPEYSFLPCCKTTKNLKTNMADCKSRINDDAELAIQSIGKKIGDIVYVTIEGKTIAYKILQKINDNEQVAKKVDYLRVMYEAHELNMCACL